ncbi:MAG TPA: molybdopterin molybdenumtransferase MoeA, partial [Paracoccaceae bacterium]|nr:molybdopterin molybdenumtransferase MoeA [Paracoccaceae bacterium]
MITVEEAQARILALAGPLQVEEVPLAQAAGRRLAAAVAALADAPPFDASAMDGYAVAGAVAEGAVFRVIGQAAAGQPWPGRLAPGEALRIFTGAMLPEGAQAVLIQEDAEVTGETVTVRPGHDRARYIRPRGQDFAAGFTLAPRRLRPADLALLAAMGHGRVPVARRPVVAVISTGDELVPPGG